MLVYLAIVSMLALSAFFSGSEIAFISANRLRVELKRQQGSRKARILTRFYESPSKFLGTMLIGNNITLVIFGMLTESEWEAPIAHLLPSGLANGFIILLSLTLLTTIIVLIFGEFFPKLLFQLFAERLLFFSAYFLKFIQVLLFPLVWVMVRLSEWLLLLFFKMKLSEEQHNFTRLDLEHFIAEINDNTEEDIDTELFNNALYLKNIPIKSRMISFDGIVSVPVTMPIQQLREVFIEKQFSKILVYEHDPTQIIGYVHQKKMFYQPQNIRQILFEITDVSSEANAYQVMNQFIKSKISIACVKNAQEKVVGMITLEDILEEIFGEIEDEHDEILRQN